MASRVNLPRPDFHVGLNVSFFYNVSDYVGPKFISGAVTSNSLLLRTKNLADDVQLVQFFLRETSDSVAGSDVAQVPTPSGTFDAPTGFWIYHRQNLFGLTVDGVVSPAKGVVFGGGNPYFIVMLNSQFLADKGKAEFENIPNRSELSPSLRASLSA
jgi:hypothetical protein